MLAPVRSAEPGGGVRHACICHHRVNAAIQNKASETAAMKTDVSNRSPQIPEPPATTMGHIRRDHCGEVMGEL
jgi:hypothetical protein